MWFSKKNMWLSNKPYSPNGGEKWREKSHGRIRKRNHQLNKSKPTRGKMPCIALSNNSPLSIRPLQAPQDIPKRCSKDISNRCLGGGWTNPIWKLCSSKWVHLPNFRGEQNIWNHILDVLQVTVFLWGSNQKYHRQVRLGGNLPHLGSGCFSWYTPPPKNVSPTYFKLNHHCPYCPFMTGSSKNQPKQCIVNGKYFEITIHLHQVWSPQIG